MDVLAIDHVQLAMPAGEEARARPFWVERLGFAEVEKPAALAGNGGCWFERGALQVHVGIDPDFRPARKAHVAFVVRDLTAARAALEPGTTTDGAPLPGFTRFFAEDPFGNRLEFLARSD